MQEIESVRESVQNIVYGILEYIQFCTKKKKNETPFAVNFTFPAWWWTANALRYPKSK